MSLDFTQFDTVAAAEQGAAMKVRHPTTGEILLYQTRDGKEPVTLTIFGEDSERCRAALRAVRNRRMETQRSAKVSAESLENEDYEILAACTGGWKGISLDGKEETPATPENIRAAYKRFPWLFEQANAFRTDRANFLKASPKP